MSPNRSFVASYPWPAATETGWPSMATAVGANGEVHFVCRPHPWAKEVFLAGSFNDWAPGAQPMRKTWNGTFRAALTLPAGVHHYKFVVDGQWLADPAAAEYAPNSLGTVNSVVRVPAGLAPAYGAGAGRAAVMPPGGPLPAPAG